MEVAESLFSMLTYEYFLFEIYNINKTDFDQIKLRDIFNNKVIYKIIKLTRTTETDFQI